MYDEKNSERTTEQVSWSSQKLRSEEFHNLYYSPRTSVIRRDEQGMQRAYGDEKSVHNFNLKTWKTLETKTYVRG
jgi:hypothetical protein